MFSTILLLAIPEATSAQLSPFPVATQGVAMSVSFDGGNYLVGIENHLTSPTTIAAQVISTNGTKVGSLIPTGRSGIATALAFDGTNHLLIWEDNELGTLTGDTGWKVYGQFISKAGTNVGSPFAITSAGIWFDGIKTMAYGGGRYLVTYTRLIVPALGGDSRNRYIAGRIVEPNGSLGDEFRISAGYGKASDVAFDGASFFVVWCEDEEDRQIRGRFVSPAGVPGAEVLINSGLAPSDNPKSVTFDGTNYLVIWNEEVDGADTGTWDVFGQRVSTTGTLVGERITVTSEPGPQMATTVSFDGANYLAVWIDMQNDTNWDLCGQFVSKEGSLVGDKLALSTEAGNQLGGAGYAHGQHLVMVNHGVVMGEGGITQVDSATGMFLAPLPALRIDTSAASLGVGAGGFGFTITGVSGQTVVIEAAAELAAPSWVSVGTNTLANGSASFSDVAWTNHASRFYRVRSP